MYIIFCLGHSDRDVAVLVTVTLHCSGQLQMKQFYIYCIFLHILHIIGLCAYCAYCAYSAVYFHTDIGFRLDLFNFVEFQQKNKKKNCQYTTTISFLSVILLSTSSRGIHGIRTRASSTESLTPYRMSH